jgi:hypothetical protein
MPGEGGGKGASSGWRIHAAVADVADTAAMCVAPRNYQPATVNDAAANEANDALPPAPCMRRQQA